MLSPAASELGRYGRTPASHFYGLPNISVPLAEVRAKGYNLPIFLSYNAGGNRPEQHPGWAGLGWSLHAGGSIVRVINGMKDEMSRLEYDSLLVTGDISPSSDPGYLYHIGEVQSETDWDNGATLAQKSIPWREYEPDEYIINVDGVNCYARADAMTASTPRSSSLGTTRYPSFPRMSPPLSWRVMISAVMTITRLWTCIPVVLAEQSRHDATST